MLLYDRWLGRITMYVLKLFNIYNSTHFFKYNIKTKWVIILPERFVRGMRGFTQKLECKNVQQTTRYV